MADKKLNCLNTEKPSKNADSKHKCTLAYVRKLLQTIKQIRNA